jgi:hypothetical protein
LSAGDVIVSVDEQDVTGERRYLHSLLTGVPVDTVVRLGLARGAEIAITATALPGSWSEHWGGSRDPSAARDICAGVEAPACPDLNS